MFSGLNCLTDALLSCCPVLSSSLLPAKPCSARALNIADAISSSVGGGVL